MNTNIIKAQEIRLTEDKKQLVLTLMNGECFENFQDGTKDNYIDDTIRTSVGVGIYWNTPMGPMNFSWGWPLKMTEYDREQRFLLSFETQF